MITQKMLVEDIIKGFPHKGQKLRRVMRSFLSCNEDLPNVPLESYLNAKGRTSADVDSLVQKLNGVLQESGDPARISITEQAALKLKEVLNSEGKGSWGVKVADRPATCGAGYEYIFEPSEHPSVEDQVFLSNGVEIYAPQASLKRFIGSLIEYEEGPVDDDRFPGLLGAGFTISNPNVKTTCACGCSNMYKELE